MREHNHWERESLLVATRHLITQVEGQTSRSIEIRADPAIRGRGRAIYAVTDPDPTRHLILCDPAEARHLDHLVAHECGHIKRFAESRPEERVVPVIAAGHRASAARQLLPELSRLVESGVPERAIADILPMWLGGILTQVADTPSDIWIERWLWREHPLLRARQVESLREQVKNGTLALRPVIAAFTPEPVWRASNSMNYALARTTSALVGRPDLIEPYWGTPAQKLGEELLEIVEARGDAGLAGDRAVSDRWAETLGVREWFDWRALEAVPTGARRVWEVGR
jgi:hypothetical protein